MLTHALIIRVPGHLLILSASISGTLSLRVGIQEVRCALLMCLATGALIEKVRILPESATGLYENWRTNLGQRHYFPYASQSFDTIAIEMLVGQDSLLHS